MSSKADDILQCLEKLQEIRSWISRAQIYMRGMVGSSNMDCSTVCLNEADQMVSDIILKLQIHDCDTHSTIHY